MHRLRHPFSGQIYSALPGGLVEVEKDGRCGVFDRYGFWIRGEVRMADAQMCRWLGTHEGGAVTRHQAGFRDQPDSSDAVRPESEGPV